MIEILKTLRDTPLPIILVIGGLIFLLVPFIRRVSDKVEVETTNKGLAGFIGFVLLAIGIGLYIIPSQSADSNLLPTAIAQTEIPNAQPAVIVVTATSKVEQSSSPTSTQEVSIPAAESLSSCMSLQNGEIRIVPAGTFILGDVIINGTAQFDTSIPNEGTVAYFETEATVTAQWGAGCFMGSNKLIDQVIQDELQHGCGSKCTSIRFVSVQNDGQHVKIYP